MDVGLRHLAPLASLAAVLLAAGLPAAASAATGGAAFGGAPATSTTTTAAAVKRKARDAQATTVTTTDPGAPAGGASPTPAGGAAPTGPAGSADPATALATIAADGATAIAPAGAPAPVVAAIVAANKIATTPYKYGGGHLSFDDVAYDCSGSVSYALHGAGLLDTTMASTGFLTWGRSGPGQWMTVYSNKEHMFVVIAGLRFDTSGQKGTATNTRWQPMDRSTKGFVVRHPDGL
jgi:hypothetical protein